MIGPEKIIEYAHSVRFTGLAGFVRRGVINSKKPQNARIHAVQMSLALIGLSFAAASMSQSVMAKSAGPKAMNSRIS